VGTLGTKSAHSQAQTRSIDVRKLHYLLIVVGLLVVAAAVAFPRYTQWREGQRVQERQRQFLNASFIRVRPSDEGAILIPNRYGFPNPPHKPIFDPMPVKPGSTFEHKNEDVHSRYRVERISDEGVIIRYESGGHTGHIKMNWK
jgi:hypothetical protein